MAAPRMDVIVDDLMLLFPIFRKKLMKGGYDRLGKRKPSAHECPILGMLISSGPLPMSQIGRRLMISKPNMTSIINNLIREGKVERLPEETDRRIIRISITKKGRGFMQHYKKAMGDVIKTNLSQLSEQDLERLYHALEEMKDITSKISEDN